MQPPAPATPTSRSRRRGRFLPLIVAALVLALGGRQAAAGPVEEASQRIEAERARLAAATTARQRSAIAERLLESRAELIRQHPDDPRRAVWLADQASDWYFVVLPIEASGLTSLFATSGKK